MSWINCPCGSLAYPKSKVECSSVVAVSVLIGRRKGVSGEKKENLRSYITRCSLAGSPFAGIRKNHSKLGLGF